MASGSRPSRIVFAESLANLPNRFVAVVLKFLVQPFGARVAGRVRYRDPSALRALVLETVGARDRLTPGPCRISMTTAASQGWKRRFCLYGREDIAKSMRAAHLHDWTRPLNL